MTDDQLRDAILFQSDVDPVATAAAVPNPPTSSTDDLGWMDLGDLAHHSPINGDDESGLVVASEASFQTAPSPHRTDDVDSVSPAATLARPIGKNNSSSNNTSKTSNSAGSATKRGKGRGTGQQQQQQPQKIVTAKSASSAALSMLTTTTATGKRKTPTQPTRRAAAGAGAGGSASKKGGGGGGGGSGERSPSPSTMSAQESKKLKRLIKNRESAQLSRNRKKAYIEELERRVAALTAANVDLSSKVCKISQEKVELEEENKRLKESKATGVDGFIQTLSKPLSTGARKATAGLLLMSLFAFAMFFTAPDQASLALPQGGTGGAAALPSVFNGRVLLDVNAKGSRVLSYQPYADDDDDERVAKPLMTGAAAAGGASDKKLSVRHPDPHLDERTAAYLFCQRAFMSNADGDDTTATSKTAAAAGAAGAAAGRRKKAPHTIPRHHSISPKPQQQQQDNPIITVVVPSASVNSSVIYNTMAHGGGHDDEDDDDDDEAVSKGVVDIHTDDHGGARAPGGAGVGAKHHAHHKNGAPGENDWLSIRCQVLNVTAHQQRHVTVPATNKDLTPPPASSSSPQGRRAARVVDVQT
eukprot:TRINITY_DN3607_c3_g1_i2.p1 TRINITY_DN3607_c3_g1~~TRINITY_DN3607_c3_g1_i2.p1  ORF type:complete len:586 (+),score=188.70 TRINITY_DN3607_c3_g1_i2:122-1879(+)